MKQYELVLVYAAGSYPVIHPSPPTEDLGLVRQLEEVFTKLRPGRGKHYELVICEVEDKSYTAESRKKIYSKQEELFKLLPL